MPCNQHCLSISSQNETNQLYGNSSILNKTVPKMVRRISGLFTLTLLQNKISMFLNLSFFGDMYFLWFFFLFTFSYSMYNLSNPNRCVTRTQPTNGHAYGPRWWITKSGPYCHFLWCDLWWKLQTILWKTIVLRALLRYNSTFKWFMCTICTFVFDKLINVGSWSNREIL